MILSTVTLFFYLYFLVEASIADNFTAVGVAVVGAIASVINTYILTRERTDRREHRENVKKAIKDGGLVAMVPERIVNEVEGGTTHEHIDPTQPDATPVTDPGA